jgi:hypothetical protein
MQVMGVTSVKTILRSSQLFETLKQATKTSSIMADLVVNADLGIAAFPIGTVNHGRVHVGWLDWRRQTGNMPAIPENSSIIAACAQ